MQKSLKSQKCFAGNSTDYHANGGRKDISSRRNRTERLKSANGIKPQRDDDIRYLRYFIKIRDNKSKEGYNKQI